MGENSCYDIFIITSRRISGEMAARFTFGQMPFQAARTPSNRFLNTLDSLQNGRERNVHHKILTQGQMGAKKAFLNSYSGCLRCPHTPLFSRPLEGKSQITSL